MELPEMNVVLFGDQTVDCETFLRKVLRRKGLPLLSSFLEQAHFALQDEVACLPPQSQRDIPSFSNVAEFVERYYEATKSDLAIESAITTLAQLTHFIGFFEEHPLEYLQPSSTHILGICTGLLAASTVASCTTITSLVPLAVQTIRISFRLGFRVSTVGHQLESCTDQNQNWSTIVLGVDSQTAQEALSRFNDKHGLVHSNMLYISAIGTMSVTITGCPSMRRQLFETSPLFQRVQRREISIRGPYHASHMYDSSDVERIISPNIASHLEQYSMVLPLVGYPSSRSTLELFKFSVLEILAHQVQWDTLVKTCVSEVRSATPSKVRVLAIGPTALGNSLISSLKVGGGLKLSLEDYVSWSSQNTIPHIGSGSLRDSKIAIVGMAGRFPNAADHEAFWQLLEQGLDVHREIPADRFDAQAHTDPSGKGKNMTHTPYGCFIDQPGLFDPRFFNMSPREATQTDPMQRLALSTAYEAMEMSGFVRDRTPSTQAHRIATFYGQTSDDWREINAAQDIDTYFITGGVRAFGPGRINYHFGFSGPSFSVDTACSSSMAAIQLACTSLRAGDCDTVFTGGMNVLTNPDIFSGLSKGQFLSKTGSCKTYDDGADGYCRGDGVVTLILKRLDDAVIDKDPILGVIAGIATNHSAEAVSITHPHIGAQQFLFQKVMDEAAVDIRDVKYVEMHGTGTQAGDGVEMTSVSSVFAPSEKQRRHSDKPLFVGSVKANIGHGEAVSGACALVKVMLMYQKNMIPPHCGIKTKINQGFSKDLKDRNLHIAFTPTAFQRSGDSPRYVFMNNFSAAGGNTATLLEDAPKRPALTSDPRSSHVVAVSAKSLWSFKQNIQRLLKWLYDQPDSVLPSLAYTTTARRTHHNYRVAIETKDLKHLHQALSTLAESGRSPLSSSRPHVAFAFTGQGSHYIGMGQKLFQDVEQFRQDIKDYDLIARNQGFSSFIGLIDGSIKDLASASPVVTQLAIVCSDIALARLWKSWGVVPSIVIGHSLGEYAALHIAGVLSILDTICLIGRRAQIMISICTVGSHGMLAVRGSLSKIKSLIPDLSVEPACINGPEETVFSGTVDQIEKMKEILTGHEIKTTMLNVPYAFHSAQVDPILDSYVASAQATVFQKPHIPVVSTLLGAVISESGTFNDEYLARHCREKVDFLGGLNAALESELIDERTIWVEIGPHPVCSNMIKSTLGKEVIAVHSLHRNDDAWKTIATSMSSLFNAGIDVDWSGYHHDFKDAHEVLSMPSYAFDEKTYWIDYKGNWCLTKGETPPPALVKPAFSTTSVHRIINEKFESTSALVIGQSDLSDPLLRAVIEGHIVNGVGLCPSSLYADMALTICDYAYRGAKPETTDVHMNVGSMETHKPLVLNVDSSSGVQLLQIEVALDFTQARAIVSYRSISADGKPVDQARCEVTFEDSATWSKEWERRKFLVEGRLDKLKAGGRGIHHIQRGLAYKLFSALVQYADRYRGMEEVTLFSEGLEATAQIQLQATSKDGNFFMSPYFIDSVAHISGFIMNANDAVDSKKQVFISHGWESMRFARNLDPRKKYVSYVKMQQVAGAGKMVAGDVYVFEGDEIIGVVGGVRFQCVPRGLLDTLLTSKSAPTVSRPVANPAPQIKKSKATKVDTKVCKTQTPTKRSMTKEIGAVTKISTKFNNMLTGQALTIIANEVGCDISELADSIFFADMGVDSLMSLSISGRFREELEIDFHSTIFNDMPTVGHLKRFLKQFETESPSESSGMTTPDMMSSDSSSDSEGSVGTPEPEVEDSDIPENQDLVRIIRSTIAEEMGVELEEISDNTDLATMGMDSLMSLSILGALREKTGLTMHSDLLVHNTCVEKIETSLGLRTMKGTLPATKNKSKITTKTSVSTGNKSETTVQSGKINLTSYPPAQSILLQGNPKSATHTLFLLPDGSGSATSYTTIPDITPSSLCVYGLNCPFMKDPESFTIGVAGVTQIYMAEIQRRQPTGPYLLGGWSAGGVLAYEMTRQFIQTGEKVEKLLLIDSPCPLGLEALPSSFHRFCDSIGLLGKGDKSKIPSWLLPHFASSVRELTSYAEDLDKIVDEIDVSDMPATTAIWARDGIVKNETDPKPEWDPSVRMPNSMHWLVNNRHDLGPNGWERLAGKNNIKCKSTTGNHFTMMREPITKDVSTLIKQALNL